VFRTFEHLVVKFSIRLSICVVKFSMCSKVFHTFEDLVVKFSMYVVKFSICLVKFSMRLSIW
jgi:hypothetical protein